MRLTFAAALLLLPVLFLPATSVEAGVNVWTPIGPDGGEINVLEAHPRRGNIVYAGTRGGVFKSTDHGATWRLSSRGLQNRGIAAIAVAPSNGAVVYAASGEEVFVSRDNGVSWSPTPRPVGQLVTVLDVSPGDARQVWAGTQAGVFRSRDGGATWQSASAAPLARIVALAVDAADPENTVYAANLAADSGSGSGVYRTTDGGNTWELLAVGRAVHSEHVRLAVDPTATGVVYASFGFQSAADPEATYRSADSGATWQLTEGGYPVAVSRVGGVYAGFMRSADRGQTWTFIGSVPQADAQHYAASASGGRVWAGTLDDGVQVRLDTSEGWQPSSRGLHATYATSLTINPRRPRVMYAATFSVRGVRAYKTESAGANWRPFDNILDEGAFFTSPQIALSPVEPARVYLAWNHNDGLLRTDHGGIFWNRLRDSNLPTDSFDPRQVLADPTDPDVVYLLGVGLGAPGEACGLARSTDRGHTFQCLPPLDGTGSAPFKVRLTADPKRPGRLWLPVRHNLIWRSDDFGATWTAVRSRGLRNAGQPRRLTVDPVVPDRLYLTTAYTSISDRFEHVWRSDDGGLTWLPLGLDLPGGGVSELLIDPQQPSNLYALVEEFTDSSRPGQSLSGVFWSRNGGRTWSPLFNGLPLSVTGLVMDPRNPRQLYALTHNLGIYAFTRQ